MFFPVDNHSAAPRPEKLLPQEPAVVRGAMMPIARPLSNALQLLFSACLHAVGF